MYKKASRLRLTYKTRVGVVSTDQLWGLKITDLKEACKNACEELKKFGKLDEDLGFLEEGVVASNAEKEEAEKARLRFEILKDVFVTRRDEVNQAAADIKKKQEIDHLRNILAEKKDKQLQEMSVEDLEKKIKELEEK